MVTMTYTRSLTCDNGEHIYTQARLDSQSCRLFGKTGRYNYMRTAVNNVMYSHTYESYCGKRLRRIAAATLRVGGKSRST